ncbi:hypothetical protein [uncultured Aquimarina sp.]|uniref:hypothetical protein n=1 Tax=uncultured Aquimarina sp. TaxID=575652 RepID=UPI00260304E3|nr:hypothetical protein [uncultured Aquimarina sp.]
MKNLKSLKESLLSKDQGSRELTTEERKSINGGTFNTLEECKAGCGGDTSGWGYYTSSGSCVYYPEYGGFWDCKDS